VLGAAGSIVRVEARHAAAIALQSGQEPSPSAFDAPLSEKQVLETVEPFLAWQRFREAARLRASASRPPPLVHLNRPWAA
jgi:hypothetical protein